MIWLNVPNFCEVALVCQTDWNHPPGRNPILLTDVSFTGHDTLTDDPVGQKVFANLGIKLQGVRLDPGSLQLERLKSRHYAKSGGIENKLSCPGNPYPVVHQSNLIYESCGLQWWANFLWQTIMCFQWSNTAAPVSIKMHWHALPISLDKTCYIDPVITGPCLSDIHNARIFFFEINLFHDLLPKSRH